MGGKIKVDNTLEERLKILREKVSRSLMLSAISGGTGADDPDVARIADCSLWQGESLGELTPKPEDGYSMGNADEQ